MTPQGMSEGGECSLQTAESTASAVSTWRSEQELMGCMLSRLQERESLYISDTFQSRSKGYTIRAGVRGVKQNGKKHVFQYLLLRPC